MISGTAKVTSPEPDDCFLFTLKNIDEDENECSYTS